MSRQTILALVLLALVGGGVWYLEKKYGNIGGTNQNGSSEIFTVATSTGETYFTVTADGRVGIGTDHPQTALEVVGPIRLSAKSVEGCSQNTTGEIAYNPDNGHFWGCNGQEWRMLDN